MQPVGPKNPFHATRRSRAASTVVDARSRRTASGIETGVGGEAVAYAAGRVRNRIRDGSAPIPVGYVLGVASDGVPWRCPVPVSRGGRLDGGIARSLPGSSSGIRYNRRECPERVTRAYRCVSRGTFESRLCRPTNPKNIGHIGPHAPDNLFTFRRCASITNERGEGNACQ